ncbi:hypothetical protein RHSIM_Rhsim07G0039300 [Rhododendron simsii]|uniref:RING-type E3 ubiquitin transferase n=1 Tax=Rhododendron simsii TaxID=118357 RepID=A0A834LH93_RHOSS|nr:hypothetical protein RHSIM_Rhsim07G0039300 [Rhododendron simsii]
MPRTLSQLDAPPSPPLLATAATTMPHLIYEGGENQQPSSPFSSSIVAILVIASALILSSSLYLLLRCIARHRHRSRTFAAVDDDVFPSSINNHRDSRRDHCSINSLPLFTFNSVTGNLAKGGDCAVCLSKFEASDRLRLLPLCCHAFHAECIDAWLSSNQTCPLCRSTVHPTESDALDKILPSEERPTSFRVEIGSISRRRGSEIHAGDNRRSYSIGSFDYIVDGGYDVSVGSTTHRRGSSLDKESIAISLETLAGEESRRSWLRDYVDHLASISTRTVSFRSSGWFGGGSSRRSDVVVGAVDLESYRIGEDITEFFRWISGV